MPWTQSVNQTTSSLNKIQNAKTGKGKKKNYFKTCGTIQRLETELYFFFHLLKCIFREVDRAFRWINWVSIFKLQGKKNPHCSNNMFLLPWLKNGIKKPLILLLIAPPSLKKSNQRKFCKRKSMGGVRGNLPYEVLQINN